MAVRFGVIFIHDSTLAIKGRIMDIVEPNN